MNLKTILSATAFLAASPTALALADQAPSDTARHILNFEDVELSALIADVSTVTGYTFVVHPEARTKRITVSSTTPLTRQQVFDVFLSSLRVHGFTAVPAGKNTYRIVPEVSAAGEAGMAAYGSNAFTTEVFNLKHANAIEAAKMLKPIIDEQGQVIGPACPGLGVVVDEALAVTGIEPEVLGELRVGVEDETAGVSHPFDVVMAGSVVGAASGEVPLTQRLGDLGELVVRLDAPPFDEIIDGAGLDPALDPFRVDEVDVAVRGGLLMEEGGAGRGTDGACVFRLAGGAVEQVEACIECDVAGHGRKSRCLESWYSDSVMSSAHSIMRR